MRVAIVGFGYMGQMYADLVQARDWELVGVHDIDNTKFQSDKFFPNRSDLIAHLDVEAVIICTPHNQHLSVVTECLKKKKHVILEKPMGSSEAETEKIYRKIQKYKDTSVVVVNITHCFYNKIQLAKQKVSELDIKSITEIRDTVVFPIKEEERDWWLFKKETVGHGVLLTNGCHLLARILYIFSQYKLRFEVVGGICSNLNQLGDIDDSQAHMRLHLVLEDQQRIPVSVFVNWPMAKKADEAVKESMEIHTDRGMLHVQAWNAVQFHPNPDEKVSQTVPYTRDTIGPEIAKGIRNVLQAFEDAVMSKQPLVHYSVEQTFHAEKTISAFYAKSKAPLSPSRLVQSLDCALPLNRPDPLHY